MGGEVELERFSFVHQTICFYFVGHRLMVIGSDGSISSQMFSYSVDQLGRKLVKVSVAVNTSTREVNSSALWSIERIILEEDPGIEVKFIGDSLHCLFSRRLSFRLSVEIFSD